MALHNRGEIPAFVRLNETKECSARMIVNPHWQTQPVYVDASLSQSNSIVASERERIDVPTWQLLTSLLLPIDLLYTRRSQICLLKTSAYAYLHFLDEARSVANDVKHACRRAGNIRTSRDFAWQRARHAATAARSPAPMSIPKIIVMISYSVTG